LSRRSSSAIIAGGAGDSENLRVDSGFGQSGRGASTSMRRRNVQDVAAVFLLIFITQLY
jgi:hypothetical protein